MEVAAWDSWWYEIQTQEQRGMLSLDLVFPFDWMQNASSWNGVAQIYSEFLFLIQLYIENIDITRGFPLLVYSRPYHVNNVSIGMPNNIKNK